MKRIDIISDGRDQIILLPEPLAFPDSVRQVDIILLGHSRLVVPAEDVWDSWFDSDGVTHDFMTKRDHPREQDREF